MTTLHKTTENIRLLFKWGGFIILGFFALIILYRIAVNIKEYFYPTPPPPPTVSFGKLPDITFPVKSSAKNFTYNIDTLTGILPVFDDRTNVYKVISPEPNLLALKRTQEKLTFIGFRSQGVKLSETLYKWQESIPPYKRILFNIQSSNFDLYSNFITDSDVLSAQNLPGETDAISLAQSFLSNLSSLPKDIDSNKTKTSILSIVNSRVIQASSLSKTQLIRIDFFQGDVNELPVYYPNPPYSIINVFVASGKYQGQIIESHFFYQEINKENSATYPIKTANQAFEELKKGQAYIASIYSAEKQVSIKNVFLAYYLGDKEQKYLMPIIVFEGNNGFYAYVNAVKDEWID